MSNLQYRVLAIVALIVASAWALFPANRDRAQSPQRRVRHRHGQGVPLKKGLDLQGGMH